ncbi:Wzz/FepE/Etk N-terminal domain-containing protein [Microbacterium sp. RU33B]|uniref:Wzz/FepE/Etk N-terminal domain-containing protein n=1 Tax=Microbacterium sp. RU33B TaxID=1907390 RepID=UPI000967353A|nr:Wzz/FepE/Etk N-terminal domain-containing protein [Microbacterium sp. RU33B]SIT84285.1 Chain length determinant protein [Microbacterium sp. RU33B]
MWSVRIAVRALGETQMTDVRGAQSSIDLGRYWSAVVSRWPMILATTGAGLLAAAVYLVAVPQTYIATTTVAVFPISSDPYASNRNASNILDMTAEAVTASSFKVANLAVESLGEQWNASELRKSTTVSAGADSTTMTIAVSADRESRARDGAGALAEAYLTARSDQAAASIDSVVQRDRDRIGDLRQQLTTAIERLSVEPPGSPAASEASADQQILNLQIAALLSRISSLEGVDTTGGSVLNPASMTIVAVEPSRTLALASGVAAGFAVGVIAAFVTHSRRKTVRGASDLVRDLEVDVLGSWDKPADAMGAIEVATQRLLRVASVHEARSIAFVYERGAEWPSPLAATCATLFRDNGVETTVVLADSAGAATPGVLQLVHVPPTTRTADKLAALRVSDLVVVVVARAVTRIADIQATLEAADEMDARVVGALLTPRVPEDTTGPAPQSEPADNVGNASQAAPKRERVARDARSVDAG